MFEAWLSIWGTAIKIRMKVDNQSNYKNLIKKIVSEGEEVSSSDINAINYASKRSRVIYDDWFYI